MGVRSRIQHAWNAFQGKEVAEMPIDQYRGLGSSSSFGDSPGRFRTRFSNEKSIVSSIYMRLGIDVSQILLRHVRKDDNGRYTETIKSGLHDCLNVEANLDQAATAFRLDIALTLFDEGVIAIVPIETSVNPNETGGFDIRQLRVGKIVAWYPSFVKVSVYNEKTGEREDLVVPKRLVAIVHNPFYSVMNEPNSVLQRIIRKLQLLDAVDEAAGSGKLDIIIKLPYTIKSELKEQQAEKRRASIETQLKNSTYGVAYVDGTENITQLNRPAENNMLKQIEYLMGQLYGQLGMDESIFLGTADEATTLNYRNRTLEPILTAVVEAMIRTFLTKTARTQGQTVDYFMDPFKLLPLSQLADLADKLLRNEVVSSNEMRALLGMRPVDDPKADQLVNSNMPQPALEEGVPAEEVSDEEADEQAALMEKTLAELEKTADDIVNSAGG
ncbi:portal protein [Microbacterium phage DizzyRudy]|nr:portal protein [Microbacterium phage DizzyRudy]WMI34450.1 portal protein [Microbacterium phage Damascus]